MMNLNTLTIDDVMNMNERGYAFEINNGAVSGILYEERNYDELTMEDILMMEADGFKININDGHISEVLRDDLDIDHTASDRGYGIPDQAA